MPVVIVSRIFRSEAVATDPPTFKVYALLVPVRLLRAEAVLNTMVAVIAPEVLASMELASATETVPVSDTASSPRPLICPATPEA